MEKRMKSITADGSKELTQYVNELEITQKQIVQIVWANDRLIMFYYE